MIKQTNLTEKTDLSCEEQLEPLLQYCSKLIIALNKDDCDKLSEDLLAVLKTFRPTFNLEIHSQWHLSKPKQIKPTHHKRF